MIDHKHQLKVIVDASPVLSTVLKRWNCVALPDAWLAAGAIAQSVWNNAFGFQLDYGINDIDIVYFDPDDPSEGAEAEHATRIGKVFSDLSMRIDVKNQARVHGWYEKKFGYPIQPYTSCRGRNCHFSDDSDSCRNSSTFQSAINLCSIWPDRPSGSGCSSKQETNHCADLRCESEALVSKMAWADDC